jgi:protein-S-isoprenylcysteine O-methyltransferase Ste14
MVGALPSIVLSAVVVARSLAEGHWAGGPSFILLLGSLVTILSFFCLGRRFAIFPRHQELCRRGAYQWLRHPAYLGELLMVGAAASTIMDLQNLLLFAGCIITTMFRIRLEEQALGPDYVEYASQVRYRLIPGVW